jgi:hypothetical protein
MAGRTAMPLPDEAAKYPGTGGLGHLTDEIAGLLERS